MKYQQYLEAEIAPTTAARLSRLYFMARYCWEGTFKGT